MSTETLVSPDWLVLVSAFFAVFFGSSIGYNAGVVHVALSEHFSENLILVSWISSLYGSMFALAGPIASVVVNASSCRTGVLLGGMLIMIGFASSSFVKVPWLLFFTLATTTGIGFSLTYTSVLVNLGYYFRKRTQLATGIAVSGVGFGMLVIPPLTRFFIETFNLHGAFLLLGGFGFQTCIFGSFMRSHPTERERKSIYSNVSCNFGTFVDSVKLYSQIFKTSPFVMFSFSLFVFSAAVNIGVLFLPSLFHATGSTHIEASILAGIMGFGSLFSRIFIGLAANDDTIDGHIILIGSSGLLALISSLIRGLCTHVAGKVFYSLMFGIYTGAVWTLMSPMILELLGIDRMANGIGFSLLLVGIGCLIGPPVSGLLLLYDLTFEVIFVIAGGLFFLSTILMMMSTVLSIRQTRAGKTEEKHTPDEKLPEEMRLMSSHKQEMTLVVDYEKQRIQNQEAPHLKPRQ